MSIYSISGTVLSSAYGIDGNALSKAYDLSGNVIFQSGSEPSKYSIENVVSYFRESTQEVEAELKALPNAWQSVIHITDMHGSGNKNHSQAIAMYLLDNTPAKMIVFGGDYSVSYWDKNQYDAYMAPYLESDFLDDIYPCLGNHETYGTDARANSMAAVYSDFLQSKTNIQGEPESIYYYFDDVSTKTRFVFINTSDSSDTRMTDAQISWIQSAVQVRDSSWSVVVFGHVNLESLGGVTTMNEANGAAIAAAIATSNGTVVGYFCGHQHIDGISTISGFHQAMLYCDKLENNAYYSGYSVTDRQEGTIKEQAVSVISFNTTTKQVVIRRVGVRSPNQTLAFSY